MAAARLSAFSLAEKPGRVTLYSSVPLRSFREEEDDERSPLNRSNAANSNAGPQSKKRYGILVSKQTVHERYKKRRLISDRRVKICDWSVGVALFGLFVSILHVELLISWGHGVEVGAISTFLRISIVLSTLVLDCLIVAYHWTEVAIISADTGHSALCMTQRRRIKLILELLICTICPCAGSSTTVEQSDLISEVSRPPVLSGGELLGLNAHIPLNVFLTMPMFARLYLLARFMVLHSALMQSAGTRTIASLNQIPVNFPFVLKSMLGERPLTLVIVVSVTYWASATWLITQCERFATERDPYLPTTNFLFDYAWFEAVTFFAIGYGDLKAVTLCGRTIAIFTGIVGTVFSSLITVLLSQRMLLSLAERRVNQVVSESQLQQKYKHAAARVLQSTWRVVRWQKRLDGVNHGVSLKTTALHLRLAQRNLLLSVLDFRQIRWKLRLRTEEEDDIITIRRAFTETEDRLILLRQRQQQLGFHLQNLTSRVDRLACVLLTRYRLKETQRV
ncbi:hypothetical protein M3Y94_00164700 [Aphelenchoides besseyi]|nr:hypothetical protein M3Y94_00164700 [Aphelenchoides besseyi]KAI6237035.1 CaMBD domain-containing protein [Aphelenchoides besseyi]